MDLCTLLSVLIAHTRPQFWERLLLLVTDPKRRYVVLEREHAAYLQLVNFRTVAIFTLMQFALLMGVWALTTFGGVSSMAHVTCMYGLLLWGCCARRCWERSSGCSRIRSYHAVDSTCLPVSWALVLSLG